MALGEAQAPRPGATEDPLGTLPRALPALATAYRQTLAPRISASTGNATPTWPRRSRRSSPSGAPPCAGRRRGRAARDRRLLLSVVNLARRRQIDPESALRLANRRFRERFAEVARLARESGKDVSEAGMAELDRYWEEAKEEELRVAMALSS